MERTCYFQPGPVRASAPKPAAHREKCCKDLSLWDKRANNRIMSLSGGMKRRVMIAKALSHEPQILFLDEPTAGVDVELRRDMWETGTKASGKTASLLFSPPTTSKKRKKWQTGSG